MGQILDGGATTTHAVRAAIQRSKAPLKGKRGAAALQIVCAQSWEHR